MTLTTGNLTLRPCRQDDKASLHALWTDPEVRRYLWDDEIIDESVVDDVIEASLESFSLHGFGQWTIRETGGESIIGFCGLRHVDDTPEIELLYGLFPAYWGRGYATEASLAVLRYAFDNLSLERIVADVDLPNARSIQVPGRVGMRHLGQRTRHDLPCETFAITRGDFSAAQRSSPVPRSPHKNVKNKLYYLFYTGLERWSESRARRGIRKPWGSTKTSDSKGPGSRNSSGPC